MYCIYFHCKSGALWATWIEPNRQKDSLLLDYFFAVVLIIMVIGLLCNIYIIAVPITHISTQVYAYLYSMLPAKDRCGGLLIKLSVPVFFLCINI